MTRENKLALVVGFALILFVGILVSDYFSGFQSRESANLSEGIKDPLADTRADQPGLIDYQILTHTTALDASTPDTIRTPPPPAREEDAIYMGAPLQDDSEMIGLDPATAGDLPYIYHEVKPHESLSSIARFHFGDPSLAAELAAYNSMSDPNSLRAGRRIRIPRQPDVLLRGGSPAASAAAQPTVTDPTPQPPAATPTYATYTIKKGDVLSRLSQELLGTTRRMNDLIELNRDVISNPDRLIPGTVIKVPQD